MFTAVFSVLIGNNTNPKCWFSTSSILQPVEFSLQIAHKNFIEEVKTNKEGLTGKDSINMKFVGIVADQRQSWFNQIFQTSELYRQLVKISCTNSIYSTTMAIARA